jgi:hypothetical protein
MVILTDCISVLLLMHENLQKHNSGGKQRLMTCTWKSNKLASTGEVYITVKPRYKNAENSRHYEEYTEIILMSKCLA